MLETWKAAPPMTARGPGKPPLPLRSGEQEMIKRRKIAHGTALLHWSVLHMEWKEANDKRKASDRAQRDSKRSRQSTQQQERSEDARRRRAVLALRSAARARSLPLLTPTLACRIGELTERPHDQLMPSEFSELRMLWKRALGRLTRTLGINRSSCYSYNIFFGAEGDELKCFCAGRETADGWKGAVLHLRHFSIELDFGHYKRRPNDETDSDALHPVQGTSYTYVMDSVLLRTTMGEGTMMELSQAEEPGWLTELRHTDPVRYKSVTRIMAKAERRRDWAAALSRGLPGDNDHRWSDSVYVQFFVDGSCDDICMEGDEIGQWWDEYGTAKHTKHDRSEACESSASSHSSDDSDDFDREIRSEIKESQRRLQAHRAPQEEEDAD